MMIRTLSLAASGARERGGGEDGQAGDEQSPAAQQVRGPAANNKNLLKASA